MSYHPPPHHHRRPTVVVMTTTTTWMMMILLTVVVVMVQAFIPTTTSSSSTVWKYPSSNLMTTSSSSSFLLYASTLESPPTKVVDTSSSSSSSSNNNNNNKNNNNNNEDIPLAPLTQWGEPYDDIVTIQQLAKQQPLPEFSYEIDAAVHLVPTTTTTATTTTTTTTTSTSSMTDTERQELEIEYLFQHRLDIIQKMQDHGCVIFRNFTLMTTPHGFTTFYNTLQMHVCCDPLHTVSARPTIATSSTSTSKKSPIYEAVNKESRKNFFIGMHNEFVGTRAPAGAAFGCFTSAPVGGEFLIADARRIFQTIPSDLLQSLYQQQIRYSVIELPFFSFIDTAVIEPLREPVANVIRNLVNFAMNQKVDFDIDLQWITNQESIYNQNHNTAESSSPSPPTQQRILQARAPKQPPIIPHPITKDPVWFCNVHSHSAVLRQQRESMYVGVLIVCVLTHYVHVWLLYSLH